MMSVKAALSVSMTAIGASALGASAYIASPPAVSATSPPVEVEVVPMPPTKFEFVLASSMNAENSTVARELMLDPLTVYGRDSVSIGARQTQEAVLQSCSPWHSLASGPPSRRVKDLCLRVPDY